MKKKLKLLDRIFMSGIWVIPIVLGALYLYMKTTRPYDPISSYPWSLMILISIMPCLYVYGGNLVSVAAGKKEFGPEDALVGRPTPYCSAEKARAMYPKIDNRLLFKEPEGIILGRELGKKNGHYICKSIKDLSGGSHVLVIGGSGSGKSSGVLISSLIANPDVRFFAIDIKAELSQKSRFIDDERTIIVDISDRGRTSWGWDILYELHDSPTEQEIMHCMDNIANSLIPLPPDTHDPFWKNNARKLLSGLLIGLYKRGNHDFISLVDTILGMPPKNCITMVLNGSNPNSIEAKILNQFDGLADETLSGVVSEAYQHLNVFLDADVRYALQVNPQRADPYKMIKEGYSIFICLPEYRLTELYDLLQIIINAVLASLERLDEADNIPCVLAIDELPRILSAGPVYHLLDAVRTLRSKKTTLLLVIQSMESIESAYTKAQVTDLVSNCAYIICLDIKSLETAKTICAMAGTYKEITKSWGPKGSITTSYTDKPILEPSDLSKLVLDEEAVLITPYGYFRAGKTPYFSDPWFKPKADKIARYNGEIKRLGQKVDLNIYHENHE